VTTIRRQLTRKLLASFAVPLVAGGAITYALIREEMTEQLDAALNAQAEAVAAATQLTPDGGLEVNASARVMQEFAERAPGGGDENRDEDGPSAFQIRRVDGTPVARSASLAAADLPTKPTGSEESRFWNLTLPSGAAGRAVTFRFRPGQAAGANTGSEELVMVAAHDRRGLDQALGSVALLLAGCGALLVGATFVVVPRVVRREFVPIDALADEASRVTADSLGLRFSVAALPGELVPIGHRLNDLLARLEASFDRERRFSADLAHELRTPLAELRALAELAVKWPEARPADADRDVLAIATQMGSVVTRLLAILRSEHGQVPIASEPVELSVLLRQLWTPFEARASARSLRVSWDVPAESSVVSDPVLLRSILANLLQNAVDYTPEGGAIAIEWQAGGGHFDVCLSNDAGALSARDVPKLFDRLWRGDAARSDVNHAGLGLPLARALARTLEGDLVAVLDDQQRLHVTLTCPDADPHVVTKLSATPGQPGASSIEYAEKVRQCPPAFE